MESPQACILTLNLHQAQRMICLGKCTCIFLYATKLALQISCRLMWVRKHKKTCSTHIKHGLSLQCDVILAENKINSNGENLFDAIIRRIPFYIPHTASSNKPNQSLSFCHDIWKMLHVSALIYSYCTTERTGHRNNTYYVPIRYLHWNYF